MATKTRKAKPKKLRDLDAIKAHGRNAQGPMKDKKKESNKNKCRKTKKKRQEEL